MRKRFDIKAQTHAPPPGEAGLAINSIEALWVSHQSVMIRIVATDIDQVTAERDYMRLHVGARSYLVHKTISELERQLDPRRFIRLRRSVIVRRDFITHLIHDGLGVWRAVLVNAQQVRIGRTYLAAAKALGQG